jgi:hypothetical protein
VYFIMVDGLGGGKGTYKLHVKGVIAHGEPCIASQLTSGLFSCEGGGSCTGGFCQ